MKEISQTIVKENQHFIQKVLCDIGNLKCVQQRRFFNPHV